MDKIDILSLYPEELDKLMEELGEKKFRSAQIYQWLHVKRAVSFDEMTNLSVALRTKMDEHFCIKRLNVVRKLESSLDNTLKYLYGLSDGNHIESVLMDYKHGTSICLSTQVGCKMGCKFCASTIAGFKRNLEPSEILMQLYEAERDSGRKVDSIVLMGIGEPLDNYDNVLRFLKILSDEKGTNMSLRHVSLSTCGLVDKIEMLRKEHLGLTLSVSLHASDDLSRSEIMPVNNRFHINELIAECRRYIEDTGRRISFEFAVIDGVNDSKESAQALIKLLRGINCHVNLIPVNKIKERNYRSCRASAERFMKYLTDGGLNATIRRTLGSDIDAACGQLRREYEE